MKPQPMSLSTKLATEQGVGPCAYHKHCSEHRAHVEPLNSAVNSYPDLARGQKMRAIAQRGTGSATSEGTSHRGDCAASGKGSTSLGLRVLSSIREGVLYSRGQDSRVNVCQLLRLLLAPAVLIWPGFPVRRGAGRHAGPGRHAALHRGIQLPGGSSVSLLINLYRCGEQGPRSSHRDAGRSVEEFRVHIHHLDPSGVR